MGNIVKIIYIFVKVSAMGAAKRFGSMSGVFGAFWLGTRPWLMARATVGSLCKWRVDGAPVPAPF